MVINRSILEKLIVELNPITEPIEAREVFFSLVHNEDIVQTEIVAPFAKLVLSRLYDKSGKGYKGIVNEVRKRIATIRYTEKMTNLGGIPVEEFFLKKQGITDTIDFDNHTPYEEKSGCGDWLKSDNPFFEDVIKEYRRKRTHIRWDYTFTIESKKHGKETYHVFIDTTYAQLFDFLSDFPKGFSTWWKENGRSGLSGLYVWEMQTIKTSRVKAQYLMTWDEWKKAKGKG